MAQTRPKPRTVSLVPVAALRYYPGPKVATARVLAQIHSKTTKGVRQSERLWQLGIAAVQKTFVSASLDRQTLRNERGLEDPGLY